MQGSDGSDRNRCDRQQRVQRKPSGIPPQFPKALHNILSRADQDGYSHIVNWLPHGRSFVVRDRERFVQDIMPRFCKQTRFASFQRQLNLYGFRRIEKRGPDHKSYYHKDFLRDSPQLVESITRTQFRGSPVNSTILSLPQTSYPHFTPPATQQMPMSPMHTLPRLPTAASAAASLNDQNQNSSPDAFAQAQFLFQQRNAFPYQNLTFSHVDLFQQYMLLAESTRLAMLSHQRIVDTSAEIPNQIAQLNLEQPRAAVNTTKHPPEQILDANSQPAHQMSRLKPPPPQQVPTPLPLMEPREPESMNEGDISNMAEFLEDVDLDTSGETSQSQDSP